MKFRGEEAEIRCKLVIGADGAYSATAKALGVMKEDSSAIYLAQRAYFKGIKLDRQLAHDRYDAYGVFCFDEHVKPGYIWVLPSGKRGIEDGYCNVGMMVYDRDAYRGMDLQERFFRCLENSPQMQAMFAEAEQVSDWQGGKLSDITQNMPKAGDGFLLIGDAASVMMPLTNDGLSAAADSAKAAADAAIGAIRRDDFSEGFLAKQVDVPRDAEDLKITKLMQQSMYDSAVMDRFVGLLNTDQVYKKKIIKKLSAE